ncbi:MAG: alpha/beta hydrolase [Steroidobacteraceae bacterium]
MATTVFHFGSDEHFLLGSFQYTPRLRQRGASILLCNPMGEESARAHRVYRVLATQLERAGYAVQRFDFFGTGDSAGEAAAATIDTWIQDIELAAAELARRSTIKRVVVVGLRLGASLAAIASHRLRPRHLILWDPIASGTEYLQELAAAHRSFMREELPGYQDTLQVDSGGVPAEALGIPITSQLAAGLAAIDLTKAPITTDHLTVISTHACNGVTRLRQQWCESPTTRWIELPDSSSWNSDAALNSATVPMDVIQAIVGRIEELSP